jgi:lauroyl/myristoyl acyltransferase
MRGTTLAFIESMAIKRRKRAAAGRRWITLQDAKLAVALPVLWMFALTVPERRWRTLCYRLESIRASMNASELERVGCAAERIIGAARRSFERRSFALRVAAGATEHHLQVLRSRSRSGWKPMLHLEGAAHLDSALAAGRGAVLWVAHFCFNALATKKALRDAGYRVWHLSRPEHGFSKSKVGIALYNSIRTGTEREQLAGRIVFDRDRPGAAAVAAMRVLTQNGILSITAGDWEGQRIAGIDVCGGKLHLAVGAPRLARLSGAALLPVFTVRGANQQTIRVVIEPPLRVPSGGETDDALQGAAQAFGGLLEQYVRRYPDEWRDWKKLEEVSASAQMPEDGR